ncbi:T9SS type A sorting domain-containing protein [Polaribacter haliotis]|uniref:T9SS type A sorting domain-containing protein n=1 Tax=Polaribacter haliotis TaxID=1888915 RepID=A0A7L8AE34_9FLAO|nr:LamG-like jellyroll fold domain-containing protein [Polaribacter haliotis]QOD60283.1 T9SS type A sorting domain-containing protein [Polaribacter haliotis]
MRKLLIFLLFWVGITQAQEQSDHKGSFLSGAGNIKNTGNNLQIQFQIGGAFQYPMSATTKTKAGFPFGVLYVPNTFSDKTYEVSKGYYPDKIRLSWSIGANEENITKVKIFRKPLAAQTPYRLLATVGKDVFEFEDTQVEGGILYQYRLKAEGLNSTEIKFVNFIEGIGYRNPTAFVSGTISFEGGSPVKDVKVLAEPIGAEGALGKGTSLQFKDVAEHMYLSENFEEISANNATVEGWFAPKIGGGILTPYSFSTEDGTEFELAFNYNGANNDMSLSFKKIGDTNLRSFTLAGSYPTGEVNAAGKDVFANLATVTNETFVHIAVALKNGNIPSVFINGREITQAYFNDANIPENVTEPTFTAGVETAYISNSSNLRSVRVGAGYVGYVDEFRIWSKALSADQIRRDYKRYLDGSETGLEMYTRMDEAYGNYAYDLSKTGFNFHKNDLITSVINSTNTVFSSIKPTKEQLGVFGITDKDGNYAISAISYAGSGEQFKVTPSFGVHKFKPASQTLFLGKEESVVNKIDYEDVSSFKFNGRIVYDTREVFATIPISDPALDNIIEIRETGYNSYLVNGTVTLNKGQYFYEGGEVNPATGNLINGELKQYPVLGIEGANILIDGKIVFDADNQPVVTDVDGKFAINVPIGKHKVEITKNGHKFTHEGRFPQKQASTGASLFDFYEDQIQERWFLDETRVTIVGKVVGGRIQSEKEIGFGFNGLKEHENEVGEDEPENKEVYSAVNNIGQATITFKGDLNTNELDYIATTNAATGEYKIKLIPYKYTVKANGGIKVASNSDINSKFLDVDEEFDVTEIKENITSSFTAIDGTEFISEPYQYEKSFRYNSKINVRLIEQEYEQKFPLTNDKNITIDVSELAVPLYKQKEEYRLAFEVTQDYVNKDEAETVVVKEYFNEGAFNITNNFASTNAKDTSVELVKKSGKEVYVYSFRAGLPNITHTDGFKSAMTIEYNVSGLNPISIINPEVFKAEGIVIGGKSADGTTFSTVAPEVPDIILRDPPGSNSFASIEKGTSISFEKSNGSSTNNTFGGGLYASVGPTFSSVAGSPFFGLETEIQVIADLEANFSKSQEINTNGSTTETYEFNETISTSDDPEYVGADGDLYIGNAKNVFYGLFNNMFVTNIVPKFPNGTDVPHIIVAGKDKDDNPVNIYISARKDYFIAEQPTNTFFSYSQKHILEKLIPDLESLVNNLNAGVKPDPDKDYQSPNFYQKQIELWQKIIQDNERDKYRALKSRATLKTEILAKIIKDREDLKLKEDGLTPSDFANSILSFIYGSGTSNEFTKYMNSLSGLVSSNFETNKSFDAGVGELTSSISTSSVISKTYEKTIDLSADFKVQLGGLINNVGVIGNIAGSHSSVSTNSAQFDEEYTSTITYTLKDNDQANVLSVDVVNLFDGSGPVFITKGGATSCPFEGPTVSNFYKNDGYNANTVGAGGEQLSEGTISVYKPELKVNKTLIKNLAESVGAVFTLQLKNLSDTGTDLEHIIYVDQTTLNGAETNIDQNGFPIRLPYNETVEIPFIVTKNSSSDVYNYENIRVYLANPCIDLNDSDAFVDVSVEFKKSCSNVSISAPQSNWVYNRTEAFNYDNQGNLLGTNALPITFTDFNTDFAGFRKITLQYRNANASSWTKFKTYYGSQALKDDASDPNGVVIDSETKFTFDWDIVGSNIADGTYEIRAIAFCTDEVSFESDIVKGTINLTPPVVFGTPSPSDGILDIGEDINVRFNEEINTHISTNITLRGLKNQQKIDHSVSVALDGSTNQIELPKQNLLSKAFSIQFWLNFDETSNGVLVNQEDGPKVTLNGTDLVFELDGQTIEATIDESQYNFYSLIYGDGANPYLEILENGKVLKTEPLAKELSFNNNNPILFGGTGIKGNIHDLRIWNKATTSAQAAAEKDFTLTGKELKLLGYWPLDEGHGTLGAEKVRARSANVNLSWTIKPKGQGYEFSNNSYLTFDNVGFVQPTNYEDITISFWVKADAGDVGTIFGNGTGKENIGEPKLTNGFRNKWDISLLENGTLNLKTEGVDYKLTTNAITDSNWHHIALIVKRGGSLNTFVDGKQNTTVSSQNIGGIAGAKLYLGARFNRNIPVDENGIVTGSPTETIENHFTGNLDEFRVWNSARSFEQIKRDRYFELDRETAGLLMYVNFNEEEATVADKGPRYNIRKGDGTTLGFVTLLNGNARKFIEDSPAIKPVLKYTNIPYTTIINGDEMIISPTLTAEEWSLFEGQILDVSVANMYDNHFNKQLSPLSFSAFVNRQEVNWFTQDGTKTIVTEKIVDESYNFVMDVVNKGGNNKDFTISGVPNYMTVSASSGTVGPNSMKQLKFNVDKELAMGTYNATIYLNLDNGYTDRLDFELRVIQDAPDWSVNPADFAYSMNIISQIKIYDNFSRDTYTKVGAFVDGEKRGEAYLVYDTGYDSYYAFLTMYSNVSANEVVTFKIWDALNGKTRVATINGNPSVIFLENNVLGTKSNPAIFNAGKYSEQVLSLNKGWTWSSFFVEDDRFNDVTETFKDLDLTDGDIVKYGTQFTRYENGYWSGSLTTIENDKAYKIQLAKQNKLSIKGDEVNPANLPIAISQGWNWLSFPIHRNISLRDALAFYEPTDGDVIKDQYSFAVYDENSAEWSGTLRYLQSNRGYMLKSDKDQSFSYPSINFAAKGVVNGQDHTSEMINSFAKYQFNMGVIAEVTTDEIFSEVKVYDNNNVLRGSSKIEEVNGKQMSFISIFSDESEQLKYVLSNSKKEIELTKELFFVSNAVQGTLKTPIELNLKSLSVDESFKDSVNMYPNPFKDELILSVWGNTNVTNLIFYNTLGVKVKEVEVAKPNTKITTNDLQIGVYFVKIIDIDGKQIVRKVIKK